MLVEERAERIQRDLEHNASDLGASDPRSTVHAEMKSYGIEGRYIALAVCRFGEFPRGFVKLRDYIARQRRWMKPRSATTSTTPRHTQAAHINTLKQ